jgi:soluble lytic murein transglycosylase-like protein
MDILAIQNEVSKVWNTGYANKTDKQLMSYQELSDRYNSECRGNQPPALARYNLPVNRKCKLTQKQVLDIRSKYVPHVYGKVRLAKEYGVSSSVILRILRVESWKNL